MPTPEIDLIIKSFTKKDDDTFAFSIRVGAESVLVLERFKELYMRPYTELHVRGKEEESGCMFYTIQPIAPLTVSGFISEIIRERGEGFQPQFLLLRNCSCYAEDDLKELSEMGFRSHEEQSPPDGGYYPDSLILVFD